MTNPAIGRPLVFFVNEGAGSSVKLLPVIESAIHRLRDSGRDARLVRFDPGDFATLENRLPDDPSLVVACGGDGTVCRFAQLTAGTGHSLGVLPMGTANLFARSLGLSMDIEEAVSQLADGHDRFVDAARVNDQLFLNSFNLGLYPRLAELREGRRAAHAHWPRTLRWLVDSLASALVVLANWRRLHFVLEVDGECLVGKTVTFAVTNNEKAIPPGPSPLDRGELVAYIPKPVSRLGMIALFMRGVFATPESLEPLRVMRAERISVHVVDGTPITIDGESGKVSGDLEVRILPGHLRVRAPVGTERP